VKILRKSLLLGLVATSLLQEEGLQEAPVIDWL
jgi:hypothetical protein